MRSIEVTQLVYQTSRLHRQYYITLASAKAQNSLLNTTTTYEIILKLVGIFVHLRLRQAKVIKYYPLTPLK